MNYQVVGLREELYVGKSVSGHNCDFHYESHSYETTLKHYCHKVELTLQVKEGECGSGWCTATFGKYSWKEVETFAEKTHTLIKPLEINIDKKDLEYLDGEDSIDNEVFYFSESGGDDYYPRGYYNVKMELFKPVAEVKTKRPVHIFYGRSNLCKSHLAALTGKSVFETDSVKSVEELPEVITEDIIVVGNRWKIAAEGIKPYIFDVDNTEVILVEFSGIQ